MKNIFLILGVIFCFSACKKGQSDLEMVITISNASYGGSIDGATVTVTKTLSGSGETTSVGSFSTDGNGQVKFTTKRDKFDYLTVTIEKPNYFGSEEKIYLSSLNTNKENNLNYSLFGKSWAAIHVRSFTPGSHVDIQKNGGKSGCAECCPSTNLYFAAPIDTIFYCINDANTTYSFIYFINGGTSTGQKSAITNFADTTEILLDF